MTKEEFEARKLWDESMMTEEEKEAHLQRVLSFCGKIDDDTFVVPPDSVPPDSVPPAIEVISHVEKAV
ncbi:MAG: hypothetical protein IJP89_09135 [Synergistaceae bacterium]|nr:hypothetical protein [Synergistaceae bacterium]